MRVVVLKLFKKITVLSQRLNTERKKKRENHLAEYFFVFVVVVSFDYDY